MLVSFDSPVDDHLKTFMVYSPLLSCKPSVDVSRSVIHVHVATAFPQINSSILRTLSCLSHL